MNKLYFHHIAKCGGTTVINILRQAIEKYKIIYNDGEALNLNIYEMTKDEIKNFDFILTHIHLFDFIDISKYFTFTVIREPFDRVFSHYKYFQKTHFKECINDKEDGLFKLHLRNNPLTEVIDYYDYCCKHADKSISKRKVRNFISANFFNHQVKSVLGFFGRAGNYPENINFLINESINLEADHKDSQIYNKFAKSVIKNNYNKIITTDRISNFINILKKKFDFKTINTKENTVFNSTNSINFQDDQYDLYKMSKNEIEEAKKRFEIYLRQDYLFYNDYKNE